MRCLTVCQDELVIRMLDEILLPGFEVEFIVESKPAARRLHDIGIHVVAGDYSGKGMNSVSPGTFGNRPSRQSAFACSIRSIELETKFHQR